MFAHPQRFLGRNAAGRTLFRRSARIHSNEVRTFLLALVFEHPQERSPRRPRAVSGVAGEFDQAFRVQVFDRHEVVLPGVVVRELVKEVAALVLQLGVAFCYAPTLFLPIV